MALKYLPTWDVFKTKRSSNKNLLGKWLTQGVNRGKRVLLWTSVNISFVRLVYDEASNTVMNAPGVETRVPGFGNTDTIDHLDTDNIVAYFSPMTDTLVSWGYERGVTVRAAPYDFRYGPGKSVFLYRNSWSLFFFPLCAPFYLDFRLSFFSLLCTSFFYVLLSPLFVFYLPVFFLLRQFGAVEIRLSRNITFFGGEGSQKKAGGMVIAWSEIERYHGT